MKVDVNFVRKILPERKSLITLTGSVECGQPATQVCSAYVDEDRLALICDKCAEKNHNEEEEEHYLLPLTNSPRSDVCGWAK
jgi:hypothetical protein